MYTLADAQEMAVKYPETFEAPSVEDIKKLKAGMYVKLCFEEENLRDGITGERMWVKIRAIDADKITGVLDGEPYNLTTIKNGYTLTFNSKHIYEIGDY